MASWSLEDRNKEAHLRWKLFPEAEKEEWNEKAKAANKIKPSEMPEAARKKMAEAALKRLANEVS